jgi:hypothetical protein
MPGRRSGFGKMGHATPSFRTTIRERWGSPHVVIPFPFGDWLYPGADVEVIVEGGVVIIKPPKRRNRPKRWA